MSNAPTEKPDLEFERLVEEAKIGVRPSWDKGNVPLNCVCLIITVLLCVALAPSSIFLILFILGPLGGVFLTLGDSLEKQQAGRSVLLGCLLGFMYLAVIASQW